MKRILIILFSILLYKASFSQVEKNVTWFDLSLKGGFGLSLLKNQNISNDENVVTETFNQCKFVGIKIGTTTDDRFGFYIESDYTIFNQKYNINSTNAAPYSKDMTLQSLDNSLSFRYLHFSGVFLELGARYSLMMGASAYYSSPLSEETGIKDQFNKGFTSLTGGFGIRIFQSLKDRYRINLFTRVVYGLTDMMIDPSLNPVKSKYYTVEYKSINKTTPFFIQLGVEFTYFAGYYSSNGGKRSIFGSNAWHFNN